ncbi:hypothetical protein [Halomicrobium salinisoli]|uniref:hypothetical protein n=1 Tax=Halomicrobium salinisoli TaxID=2878391 RepID=UPI001CF0BCC3|nr:hypothetical protein [Halomicrobium salinisoli]
MIVITAKKQILVIPQSLRKITETRHRRKQRRVVQSKIAGKVMALAAAMRTREMTPAAVITTRAVAQST